MRCHHKLVRPTAVCEVGGGGDGDVAVGGDEGEAHVQEESDEINLTPMLDVVFIMLIFFIVTANFIKEPGLEINRPDSDTAETQENAAILIAVGPTGEVWMDGRRIDVRQVKANVVKLLADNPQGSVVIQADEKAMADTIIQVMDGAREAGVSAISLASEPK